ncbi:MAG: glycosyltransferase [Terracidiphilus sp.]
MLEESQNNLGTLDIHRQPHVCAAIVTYRIGTAIHRCFDSIYNQVGHVLIIDNGSDELTRRELDKLAAFDSVSLILNERNEGLAHAYNQAVQWAKIRGFRWILTLDHDSEATPGMVDKLVRVFDTLERQGIRNVGAVGANPFDVNVQEYIDCIRPRESAGPPLEIGTMISSGSLISLAVLNTIGPFNEDLFIYYIDTDFCVRLVQAGFGVYACPEALLLHREGSKRRHRFLWRELIYDHYDKTSRYYLTRNTIYMMKRHHLSTAELHAMLLRTWRDHVRMLLFDKERFASVCYSLRGAIDGLRGKVGPMKFQESGLRG